MKKTQKGITLVALVITIIVLLILAVVAIGAVRDSGIIGYAQNSAETYNLKKKEENTTLVGYESEISKYLLNASTSDPIIGTYIYAAYNDIMTFKANGKLERNDDGDEVLGNWEKVSEGRYFIEVIYGENDVDTGYVLLTQNGLQMEGEEETIYIKQ